MDMQGEFESRKLWQHVTNALRVGDVNTATEHKKFVSFLGADSDGVQEWVWSDQKLHPLWLKIIFSWVIEDKFSI